MTFWDFMFWTAVISLAAPFVIGLLVVLFKGIASLFKDEL